MYYNLTSLGINNPHDIDRYGLRQEANNDILKNKIYRCDQVETDLKRKILADLHHLESVVTNKIAEIESDLDKLTCNNR